MNWRLEDVAWPPTALDDQGRPVSFAAAVADLLDAMTRKSDVDVEALARQTPAGPVGLPVQRVGLAAGVELAAHVDAGWLAEVERRRAAARAAVVSAGRAEELDAALHVALLLEMARVGDRVASGARLWLLAGAVASALAGGPDHFGAWGRLVAAGWWPIGPSGGRLVLAGE